MKLLSSKQIAELDKITIKNEPINSWALMERAALKLVNKLLQQQELIVDYYSDETRSIIKCFCGSGNNGGDGFSIARHLISKGFVVEVYWVQFSNTLSNDALINYNLLLDDQIEIKTINDENIDDVFIKENDLVLDAIFGTGLNRPIQDFTKTLVQKINQSGTKIISIDIPSGLFADDNRVNDFEAIIKADITYTFQLPKISFLQPQNQIFTGSWEVLDIGLQIQSVSEFESNNYWVNKAFTLGLMQPRKAFSHKGTFGHALLIGGSLGKIGSIAMATKACLRAGSGLVTVCVPQCGVEIVQTLIPEAMVLPNQGKGVLEGNIEIGNKTAIGIGVGVGLDEKTAKTLQNIITNTNGPLVIDADGINILAENKTWLAFLPNLTILTPHPGEFKRLVGDWQSDEEKIEKLKEFSRKFNLIVILKGAFSIVCTPNGNLFYNSTGNAGMATAGSGDVLFGIITGYLAQGLSPLNAAILGVYNHGLAGDLMVESTSQTALIATDIIEGLRYC